MCACVPVCLCLCLCLCRCTCDALSSPSKATSMREGSGTRQQWTCATDACAVAVVAPAVEKKKAIQKRNTSGSHQQRQTHKHCKHMHNHTQSHTITHTLQTHAPMHNHTQSHTITHTHTCVSMKEHSPRMRSGAARGSASVTMSKRRARPRIVSSARICTANDHCFLQRSHWVCEG